MQLRLNPKFRRESTIKSILFKGILIVSVLFIAIFILDKFNTSGPTKFIKQELSNYKFITIK